MTVVGRIGSGGVMSLMSCHVSRLWAFWLSALGFWLSAFGFRLGLAFPKAQSLKPKAESVPLRRIQDARLRAWSVRERREVHVVPGSCADGSQQRAIDPGHERAIQLAGSAEPLAIVVHVA